MSPKEIDLRPLERPTVTLTVTADQLDTIVAALFGYSDTHATGLADAISAALKVNAPFAPAEDRTVFGPTDDDPALRGIAKLWDSDNDAWTFSAEVGEWHSCVGSLPWKRLRNARYSPFRTQP
jgi:hypothetical protein